MLRLASATRLHRRWRGASGLGQQRTANCVGVPAQKCHIRVRRLHARTRWHHAMARQIAPLPRRSATSQSLHVHAAYVVGDLPIFSSGIFNRCIFCVCSTARILVNPF